MKNAVETNLIINQFLNNVTIFHYLAVATVALDYFETCSFFLLRNNVDYVLRTCFFVCSAIWFYLACLIHFFVLLRNSVKLCIFSN